MGDNLKRHFRLLALYAKMDLAMLLRDLKTAVVYLLTDIIANLSSIAGIFLLAWRFDGTGGMEKYEVLLMMAYTTLITGVFQVFCAGGNVGQISRRVGRGQVDHMLIQPLPLRTQLMTEGFLPFTGAGNLLAGIAVLFVALYHLQITVTWWWVLSLVLQLFVSMVIILSQSYLAATAAFYAPAAAEEISALVVDVGDKLGQYPLSGMSKEVKIVLLMVIPSGLLGWFPTLVLLGKPPLDFPAYFPVFIALVFLILAQIFFRKGLRYYVQKGSNRYLPYGHRR